MTEDPEYSDVPSDDSSSPLDELVAELRKQFEMASQDRVEELLTAIVDTDRLLPKVGSLLNDPDNVKRANEIRELHRRISLAVAAKKDEAARRLRKIGLGKQFKRAYRPGP